MAASRRVDIIRRRPGRHYGERRKLHDGEGVVATYRYMVLSIEKRGISQQEFGWIKAAVDRQWCIYGKDLSSESRQGTTPCPAKSRGECRC